MPVKLWEISNLMTSDKLFKIDDELVNTETGEILQKEYLDQLPMKLEEKTKNIGLVVKNYKADAEQISAEIKRLQGLKKSCERKISSLQQYILMYGCPVEDIAVTVRFNAEREAVKVEDGVELPEEYRAYKWTPDKAAIKEALKNGAKIAGCSIVKRASVTIK